MVVLDATIVAVALPAIGSDLGLEGPALAWVLSAYALVFGGFLMLMGRAADMLGRRRVLVAGFALFGAASLACGLATGAAPLIGARVAQGLGAAAVSPAALALLTAGTPEGRARTRALAAWTAAAAGGGALGWVAGGAIADGPGWPWVFLVNVAPCVLAVVLALRLLPADAGRRGEAPLDVAGAVSATAGLALLVLGFTRAEQAGIGDAHRLGLAGRERRAAAGLCAHRAPRRRPAAPPGHPRAAAAGRRAARVAGDHHGEHRLPVPVRAPPPARAGSPGDGDRAAVRALQPRRDRRLGGRRAARGRGGPARDRRAVRRACSHSPARAPPSRFPPSS